MRNQLKQKDEEISKLKGEVVAAKLGQLLQGSAMVNVFRDIVEGGKFKCNACPQGNNSIKIKEGYKKLPHRRRCNTCN